MARSDFLATSSRDLLELLAAEEPPASGSAAALTGAMAAALVEMAAGAAGDDWPEARGIVAQARVLRIRLAGLVEAAAEAYGASLAAFGRENDETDDPATRDFALRTALERAAEVPLLVAETSCDVALVASLAATRAAPQLQADARAAALLSEAAASAAAHLVEVNLAAALQDARVRRAREAAATAEAAVRASAPPDSLQSAR